MALHTMAPQLRICATHRRARSGGGLDLLKLCKKTLLQGLMPPLSASAQCASSEPSRHTHKKLPLLLLLILFLRLLLLLLLRLLLLLLLLRQGGATRNRC